MRVVNCEITRQRSVETRFQCGYSKFNDTNYKAKDELEPLVYFHLI